MTQKDNALVEHFKKYVKSMDDFYVLIRLDRFEMFIKRFLPVGNQDSYWTDFGIRNNGDIEMRLVDFVSFADQYADVEEALFDYFNVKRR